MSKIRCIQCRNEFNLADIHNGITACPNCGSNSSPCDTENDVNIKINWQELRILCMWAEKWGHEKCGGAGVVYSIATAIRTQLKDCALPPLTLAGECDETKKHYPTMRHNIPGAEESGAQ